MDLEYSLSREDFRAWYDYFSKHKPDGRPKGKLPKWLIWCAGVEIVMIADAIRRQHPVGGTLASFFVIGLLFLLGILWSKWQWKRAIRKTYLAYQKANSLAQRVRISSEGFFAFAEKGATLIKWSGVERIAVTDNHCFVLTSPTNAFVVPKTAFSDEGAFAEFVEKSKQWHGATHSPPKLDTNIRQ